MDTAKSALVENDRHRSVREENVNTLSIEDEMATYYLLVADSNTNYYKLRDEMFFLHDSLKNPIDTMGRLYNKEKDLIALPVADQDEMYRGEYFPRRFPSNSLSLEYLNFYKDSSKQKTIALIAGIYESKNSADSALMALKKYSTQAFTFKARIYVGCMH